MKKQKAEAEMDAQVFTQGYIKSIWQIEIMSMFLDPGQTYLTKQIVDCSYS